jgi:signal transduction histidine kinase
MPQTVFTHKELERLFALSELNIDFSDIGVKLRDLTTLAAKLTGMETSFVNIIDNVTQWTIAAHGFNLEQMPREESVCQYTILENRHFEVPDLSSDERFKDRFYVAGEPGFRYYYGIPLSHEQHNLGALCVLDTKRKQLSPEKTELLQLIAAEVVERLKLLKHVHDLQEHAKRAKQEQNKVLHDIRGPLGGIIQLSELISAQGKQNDMNHVLDLINMIHSGSKSILELADSILSKELRPADKSQATSGILQQKLSQLYLPQAKGKEIELSILSSDSATELPVSINKLLQIAGNLISNAIKFTPRSGQVEVHLNNNESGMQIVVTDTGIGLSQQRIEELLGANELSGDGSEGEKGYAFGLQLVKHLLAQMNGSLTIKSAGAGATFTAIIPNAS